MCSYVIAFFFSLSEGTCYPAEKNCRLSQSVCRPHSSVPQSFFYSLWRGLYTSAKSIFLQIFWPLTLTIPFIYLFFAETCKYFATYSADWNNTVYIGSQGASSLFAFFFFSGYITLMYLIWMHWACFFIVYYFHIVILYPWTGGRYSRGTWSKTGCTGKRTLCGQSEPDRRPICRTNSSSKCCKYDWATHLYLIIVIWKKLLGRWMSFFSVGQLDFRAFSFSCLRPYWWFITWCVHVLLVLLWFFKCCLQQWASSLVTSRVTLIVHTVLRPSLNALNL